MRKFMSELEEVVLRTIQHLNNDAYGVEIRDTILGKTGKTVSLGSIYATLERLEDKGYLSARMGEATEERGGKAKRYYSVNGAGQSAIKDADSTRASLAARVGSVPVTNAFGTLINTFSFGRGSHGKA